MMKFSKYIFASLMMCLGLCACEPSLVRYPMDPHLNVEWHHFGKTHLLNELRCCGIYVLQVGEQVRIIVPTDRLFYFDTPTFIANYQPCLMHLANFIKHYGPVCHVEVSAYTDNVREFCDNKALSLRQAKAMAGFLWAHGIPITAIRPIGFGPTCPIANNYTSLGSYFNRRVEIKFISPTFL